MRQQLTIVNDTAQPFRRLRTVQSQLGSDVPIPRQSNMTDPPPEPFPEPLLPPEDPMLDPELKALMGDYRIPQPGDIYTHHGGGQFVILTNDQRAPSGDLMVTYAKFLGANLPGLAGETQWAPLYTFNDTVAGTNEKMWTCDVIHRTLPPVKHDRPLASPFFGQATADHTHHAIGEDGPTTWVDDDDDTLPPVAPSVSTARFFANFANHYCPTLKTPMIKDVTQMKEKQMKDQEEKAVADGSHHAPITPYQGQPIVGQIYRHYGGNDYVIVANAQLEHTCEPVVVYKSTDNGDARVWVRGLDNFNFVTIQRINGVNHAVRRFTLWAVPFVPESSGPSVEVQRHHISAPPQGPISGISGSKGVEEDDEEEHAVEDENVDMEAEIKQAYKRGFNEGREIGRKEGIVLAAGIDGNIP